MDIEVEKLLNHINPILRALGKRPWGEADYDAASDEEVSALEEAGRVIDRFPVVRRGLRLARTEKGRQPKRTANAA
jgi:hypothetical protein